MVRREAFPLSGDAGHRRHPRHDRGGHAAAAGRDAAAASSTQERRRRLRRARDVVHRPVDHQAVQRRARRRQRHGRHGRAAALRPPAVQDDEAVLRGGRHLPEPRSQPADRGEPPRHRRAGDQATRPTSASPGTATPTAASSSTAAASSSPATSSPRCWPRRSCSSTRARRSSTTSAPATR